MATKDKKSTKAESYTYRAIWSEEDGEYVGLCAEFPSLSHLADSKAKALNGIVDLVAESIKDMKKSKEQLPTKSKGTNIGIGIAPGTDAFGRTVALRSRRLKEGETRLVLVQNWEESERGWGVRSDGYTVHIDEKQHRAYLDWYNKTFNNKSYVPDEYTRASGDPVVVSVPVELFDKIAKATLAKKDGQPYNGIWGKSKYFDKAKTDLAKDLFEGK